MASAEQELDKREELLRTASEEFGKEFYALHYQKSWMLSRKSAWKPSSDLRIWGVERETNGELDSLEMPPLPSSHQLGARETNFRVDSEGFGMHTRFPDLPPSF